jgi:hypothetical protein
MSRPRVILGIFVGVVLIASSAAHSLLGWPQLAAELARYNPPADLVAGLRIGWQFAGVAMFAFGIIVIHTFASYLRGRAASLRPPQIISLAYLSFGLWALAVSRFNPFFFVFIIPGLTLVATSWWPASPPARPRE